MHASGTAQFSIVLGSLRRIELQLDEFWNEFAAARDAAVITRVVEAARAKLNVRRAAASDAFIPPSPARYNLQRNARRAARHRRIRYL